MFFLIRSVFWLSIVFSSMSWAVDASQPRQPHAFRDVVVQSGLAIAGATKDAALSQARAWCIKSLDQCMADAAQLTALIVANQSDDASGEGGGKFPASDPLPHSGPRHHISSKAPAAPRS